VPGDALAAGAVAHNARPTGPLCDGCHSVDYHLHTKQVSEGIAKFLTWRAM